jgi:peptide/nickel transport system ATP-binding protein
MYAGEVVESAPTAALFAAPTHPYTRGLLECIPVPGTQRRDEPLGSIPGVVPRIAPGFAGCAFRDRCPEAMAECARDVPRQNMADAHSYLCRLPPGWPRAAAA